jgi:predicted ATPase with chaperone activity
VQESRERVRAAIKNPSFGYPFNKRITVNLAPGDLRKVGSAYELPIAAGQQNVIMVGSLDAGKTLLARSMPSILPNLMLEEALEVTRI